MFYLLYSCFLLFDFSISLNIYICVCMCRFRPAPHRWLSTFSIAINQRVSNSTQRQLMHQQKVSYRMPIVSIFRSLAPLFGTCLYWRRPVSSISLFLCLSLSSSRRPRFFALFAWSIVKYVSLSLLSVWWSELSPVRSQLAILCNWTDLTDAATFSARCTPLSLSLHPHSSCLQ